jgi:aryl-alcohol dehydrogenase-like predicted oxidoreductase
MTDQDGGPNASAGGTFALGGDLAVNRMGFGAMRITGWGEPENSEEAKAVLRRAVELGVNFIDTADAYGPEVSERLIAEALHPYPEGLVIATKGGFTRPRPTRWVPDGRPEHLREACEGSLRRLKVDRIDLYQLHRIDPRVPAEESLGALAELQEEGKIRYVGLSEVGAEEIERAREIVPVASVQNRYNLADRGSESVLDLCEREGLAFIPWAPLANGTLARQIRQRGPAQRVAMALTRRVPRRVVSSAKEAAWALIAHGGSRLIPRRAITSARRSARVLIADAEQDQLQHNKPLLEKIAAEHDATPGQVALAWLLMRSSVMLPIPGTSSVGHLEENVAAADLRLIREEFEELAAAVS